MITWNISTGKIINRKRVNLSFTLSDFEIYKMDVTDKTYEREWYSPSVLINSYASEPDFKNEDFYEPSQLKSSLKNNEAYIKILQHTYHKFKVLTIISEEEVKEEMTFIWPKISSETYLKLFFSENFQNMLVRFQN